ncbi:methyltransferase type 11 [Capsaspora owczarzaki ATCC 30864]|uniref:Methyltransferase type 11 n=1 Tax=Capsaspora owczarzaki (strain ATCC 30864) TaxID=595528 RepID=A0A0D2UJH9_CAPO3|nr:methyltransferase type 11 [Capsaspora owczarzaki ATCC 30864]KJE95246.1 methyltransferase type 11 [Capsaspora owczarzaki ATCC 30864]|eukprot:XP_004346393.1 methyltransferase type 11 [Capsaspora owczarzaki ATCC 30864]
MSSEIPNAARFASKVDNYVKYRPSYPVEVVRHLESIGALPAGAVVVDLGAGTGISAKLLLSNSANIAKLFAVEPSANMRAAAEASLADETAAGRVAFVDGSAHATTLPDASADLIVAFQAMHWFDPAQTRAELLRIAKPGAYLAAVWNHRFTENNPLNADLDQLLVKHAVDYAKVSHGALEEHKLPAFFGPGEIKCFKSSNSQTFDEEGFLRRQESSSYFPAPTHPNYDGAVAAVRALYAKYKDAEGKITLVYETRAYYAKVHSQ